MKKRADVGADHDALAADAVVEDAGGGRGEGAGENLQNDGEPDCLGLAAGEFEQEVVDGERVEPVAEFADDLGEPEEAEVAVAAEEREVGGAACGLRVQAHAFLDGADGAVGDGRDALRAFAENAGEVGGVGGDFAIALLERFEVRDHHFGHRAS